MPLFPNASTYYKGRTHTQLVISEGNAPAEKYIPSAATNAVTKFTYEFGPEGNQEVVIPKGKAVAISGMEWDYETEHMVPAIKIANGLTDVAIGVNHHNVYKRIRDRFSGNQPTIITREYIEVPLFGSQNAANDIKFGAAWAADPNALLGKYVAIDEYGNFTLATGAYANADIIGQCLGIETDVPPAGYLQYFMEMEDAQFAQFMKDMSYAPSPGKTKNSAWNDIGMYPEGTGYLKSKESLMKAFRSGIPFLTDGYFRSRTQITFSTASGAANAITADRIKVTGGLKLTTETVSSKEYVKDIAYTGTNKEGSAIFLRLPEKLVKDNLQLNLNAADYPEFAGQLPSDVLVKIVDKTALAIANAIVVGVTEISTGVTHTAETKAAAIAACYKVVGPQDVHVDYTNNIVVVYLDNFYNANYNIADGLAADETTVVPYDYAIEVTGVVLQNQIPGIPTGWDFKGGLGAARILLQK